MILQIFICMVQLQTITSTVFLFYLMHRLLLLALTAMESACAANPTNCRYLVMSNKFCLLVDLTCRYLVIPPLPIVRGSSADTPSPPKSSDPLPKSREVAVKVWDSSLSSVVSNSVSSSTVSLCEALFGLMSTVFSLLVQAELKEPLELVLRDSIRCCCTDQYYSLNVVSLLYTFLSCVYLFLVAC